MRKRLTRQTAAMGRHMVQQRLSDAEKRGSDFAAVRWTCAVMGSFLFTALLLRGSALLSVGYDGTQERRILLQADLERAVQDLGEVVSISVFFDKEDARRSLLVTDVLTPLRFARKDVRVSFPLDEGLRGIGAAHDEQYGKLRVCGSSVQRFLFHAAEGSHDSAA